MKNTVVVKERDEWSSLEKQISDVAEGLKDVVTKSELADITVLYRKIMISGS